MTSFGVRDMSGWVQAVVGAANLQCCYYRPDEESDTPVSGVSRMGPDEAACCIQHSACRTIHHPCRGVPSELS